MNALITSTNFWCKSRPYSSWAALQLSDRNLAGPYNAEEYIPAIGRGPRANVKAFARKNQVKKSRKQGRLQKSDTSLPSKQVVDEQDGLPYKSPLADDYIQDSSKITSHENSEEQTTALIPTRGAVLQACTVTSCLIGASGVIIRQISHLLHQEGLPITDCFTEIPFTFEVWHLELIAGLVILVSSCRYLLLKTWPNFAKSSEAANRQVLTSLEPLDYMVVAFLPGVSEELLFRGALLPIFGINWNSVLAVAALFGILHLGSGRKYSFAVC